jgi:hypothetical protein
MRHIFSESPSLVIQIANSFVSGEDVNFNKLNLEDIIVLTQPFEKIEKYENKNNFSSFFKELEES